MKRTTLVALSVFAVALVLGITANSQAGSKVIVGHQWAANVRVTIDQIDHRPWDALLQKHVDAQGMVNYAAWKASPGDPSAAPEILWDRSWQDRYSDPGTAMMRRDERGRRVLRLAGNTIFLTGAGASDEGDRPFFDTLDLGTKETVRHFRSEAPHYERPWLTLDDAGRLVLTRREAYPDSKGVLRWWSRRARATA